MSLIKAEQVSEFFKSYGKVIYNRAESTIDKYSMKKLLSGGVVLGFSGGADSLMCLLFLLEYRRRADLDFPILAAHINHCIRGDESDRDEAFCRSVCRSLSVEMQSYKIDVPGLAKERGEGVEECARNVRYSVFNDIIQGRSDVNCICVAHNLGDLTETVILNMLRGGGSRGGAGIPPVRDNIVRPLIEISKSDIISSLSAYGIDFAIDSTNFSNEYKRNYIRNEIIPRLDCVGGDPERAIARFASNLRSDDDFIRSCALDFIKNNDIITNRGLASLHYSVFVRVISILAEREGAKISAKIAVDIYSNLNKDNFSYSIIGARFVCERSECRIANDGNEPTQYFAELSMGENYIPEIDLYITLSEKPFDKSYSNVYKKSIQAKVSSAIIRGKACVRPKKDGDTVFYGGMTRKLKKLFNDRKISAFERSVYPVVCDDLGVLAVPGFGVREEKDHRQDEDFLYLLFGYGTKESQ